MTSKKVIAVDVDDVLADENGAVIDFMNEHYKLGLDHADYDVVHPYWGFWERVWGVTDEEGAIMHEHYVKSGVKRHLKVKPGAIDAITRLRKDYKLVVITARSDMVIDLTHEWLEEHFPKAFKSVEFVVVWSGGDQKASKADIARSLNAQYLIDDNADHCRAADELGIKSLLFGNYGWNRDEVIPTGVKRVEDWGAVMEYFYGSASK